MWYTSSSHPFAGAGLETYSIGEMVPGQELHGLVPRFHATSFFMAVKAVLWATTGSVELYSRVGLLFSLVTFTHLCHRPVR